MTPKPKSEPPPLTGHESNEELERRREQDQANLEKFLKSSQGAAIDAGQEDLPFVKETDHSKGKAETI